MADGLIREYIIRVIDETDGNQMIPQSAQMAEAANIGTVADIKRTSGTSATRNAQGTSTKIWLNAGLRIGMPVFNAITHGVAGKVVGPAKNVIQLVSAIATGASVGGIVGAAASVIGWGVSELVNYITSEIERNKAEAERLNNRDNLLMRSGAKSYATFYNGSLSGIKKTNRT